MYACINIAAITSFRASRTLDFGCICALATESQSTWLVRPGNKPGFNDILWKAMSMYEMWQLLHSILNTHTSAEALGLEIETENKKKIIKNTKLSLILILPGIP